MEFPIEIAESGILSDPAPTSPVSGHPAGADAEAEYAKMMSDPTHPHYAGLRRGDKESEAYANGLFRKAYGTAPVPIESDAEPVPADLSPDAQAQIECETHLRAAFGHDYDATMTAMASGAKFLFEGDEGQTALATLADRLAGLGSKAEALGVKFLADLAQLNQQGG